MALKLHLFPVAQHARNHWHNMTGISILALRNRIDKYESLGKLFENTKADVVELRLQERLIALLIAILDVIATLFEQLDEQDVIKKIINDEQAFEKIRLLINPHENRFKSAA